mmetsp:Transcript_143204/g.399187  ORF Transcript_143204/g.399187 Transcript_143204/m.399187 type:complete len:414 (+) Transcript_143204:205-1446(+)
MGFPRLRRQCLLFRCHACIGGRHLSDDETSTAHDECAFCVPSDLRPLLGRNGRQGRAERGELLGRNCFWVGLQHCRSCLRSGLRWFGHPALRVHDIPQQQLAHHPKHCHQAHPSCEPWSLFQLLRRLPGFGCPREHQGLHDNFGAAPPGHARVESRAAVPRSGQRGLRYASGLPGSAGPRAEGGRAAGGRRLRAAGGASASACSGSPAPRWRALGGRGSGPVHCGWALRVRAHLLLLGPPAAVHLPPVRCQRLQFGTHVDAVQRDLRLQHGLGLVHGLLQQNGGARTSGLARRLPSPLEPLARQGVSCPGRLLADDPDCGDLWLRAAPSRARELFCPLLWPVLHCGFLGLRVGLRGKQAHSHNDCPKGTCCVIAGLQAVSRTHCGRSLRRTADNPCLVGKGLSLFAKSGLRYD